MPHRRGKGKVIKEKCFSPFKFFVLRFDINNLNSPTIFHGLAFNKNSGLFSGTSYVRIDNFIYIYINFVILHYTFHINFCIFSCAGIS